MGHRVTYQQTFRRLIRPMGAILILAFSSGFALHSRVVAAQSSKASEPGIPLHYTDVRESAKITFQQDSTQTEEKYYLETMGTGVAWIDYDQDGLMDLYFVQSAATDLYKPAHPLRSTLYHTNDDRPATALTHTTAV